MVYKVRSICHFFNDKTTAHHKTLGYIPFINQTCAKQIIEKLRKQTGADLHTDVSHFLVIKLIKIKYVIKLKKCNPKIIQVFVVEIKK